MQYLIYIFHRRYQSFSIRFSHAKHLRLRVTTGNCVLIHAFPIKMARGFKCLRNRVYICCAENI